MQYISHAVCLDGSLPAYHIHRGYGSGANSWLIQLEVCDNLTAQKAMTVAELILASSANGFDFPLLAA